MRPNLADEFKAVALKGADQFPGGEGSKAPIVDGNDSGSEGDSRRVLGYLGNLNIVRGAFGKGSSFSKEFFDNHANDFVDVLQCLIPGTSRGCGANGFERRAVGVPGGIAQGVLVRLDNNFETVGLHDRQLGPETATFLV